LDPATVPVENGFRLRGLAMTRIETFTDAAFAFALTLLVLSLDPPTDLAALGATLRDIPAFLASATLLMVFWWGHHEWSRRYGLDDAPTVVLSSMLVFTVLIYVYPLRLMSRVLMDWLAALATGAQPAGVAGAGIRGPDDVATVFTVYGAGFVAMCAVLVLLNVHAWRQRSALRLDSGELHDTVSSMLAWSILLASGLVSILIATAAPAPHNAMAGWVYAALGVAMPVFGRARARSRPPTRHADASRPWEDEI
jgi:uncharacterized membrane protein